MIRKRRKITFVIVTSFLTAFCCVAGYYLDNFDSLDLLSARFYIQLAVGTLVAFGGIYGLWFAIEHEKFSLPHKLANLHIPYVVCIVVLLLCWLPTLLSTFPGVFSYDAYNEWEQVRDGIITAHHPVIHVLLLGGLVEGIYQLTGSYNAGIAVYSILQMVLLANIFAYSIHLQKRMHMKSGWQLLSLIFYALSPVIQLFSICATKDVLFFGAMLLFLQYIMILWKEKERFFDKRTDIFGLGISAFFTMILRNNGLYIVVAMVVLLLLAFRKLPRKNYYKLLLCIGSIFLLWGIYTGPVYGIFSVEKGGMQEMLSVPIQQMARVYKYDKAILNPQEIEFLYQVLPQENLEEYRATVSDLVKVGFQEEIFKENWQAYLKLWIKWGVEHPLSYINSFLVNTVDFWYPFAVVDGYKDAYGQSSYFDYRVAEPGTEIVILPRLNAYYDAISHDRAVQEAGWTALFMSPGLLFVVFVIIFFYHWCYQKYELVMPMLIIWLNFATVLLGPIALVRYVLIFFYALPLLLGTFKK